MTDTRDPRVQVPHLHDHVLQLQKQQHQQLRDFFEDPAMVTSFLSHHQPQQPLSMHSQWPAWMDTLSLSLQGVPTPTTQQPSLQQQTQRLLQWLQTHEEWKRHQQSQQPQSSPPSAHATQQTQKQAQSQQSQAPKVTPSPRKQLKSQKWRQQQYMYQLYQQQQAYHQYHGNTATTGSYYDTSSSYYSYPNVRLLSELHTTILSSTPTGSKLLRRRRSWAQRLWIWSGVLSTKATGRWRDDPRSGADRRGG